MVQMKALLEFGQSIPEVPFKASQSVCLFQLRQSVREIEIIITLNLFLEKSRRIITSGAKDASSCT